MSVLSPEKQFEDIKASVARALEKNYNVSGKVRSMSIENVEVKDNLASDDVEAQKKAILAGKSWTVPVYGDVVIKDVNSGNEVLRKRLQLLRLPKLTDRFGYIVDGNEYQVLNQFRLKSGVYHRMAPNGDVLSEFNLANSDQFANGRSFKIRFDPSKATYYLDHRESSVPLYPLLGLMGITDSQLEKAWGKEILDRNREKASIEKSMGALRRAVGPTVSEGKGDAELLHTLFGKTKLLAETTKETLGKPYTTVDPEVLLKTTTRLVNISRGDESGDDKPSLQFQSVHAAEDLFSDYLARKSGIVKSKVRFKLDRAGKIREALPADAISNIFDKFFSTALKTQGEQTNPLEMISGHRKTTTMGELGGIQSTFAISEESKLINPSHLGFLDPIHTPEGEKTGVTLALPIGAEKKGNDLVSNFWNPRTKKRVKVDAGTALKATVAFPDQYEFTAKGARPLSDKVKATRNGEVIMVSPKDVDYVIPSPRAVFGVASNLIPFLQNNQGNRAMTAARQQEQAVPLVNREAPLVQVKTDRAGTFEDIVGTFASKHSPVDGEVAQVREKSVIIKDKKGESHVVNLYKDFPLAGNSLYDSEVKVKAGDRVKKGQLVADSTFTKDGKLALGTSLKTAYMPWYGLNFEDGIVISESAAQKLTSLHAHKKDIWTPKGTLLDKKQYLSRFNYAFSKDQIAKIGDDGVITVGSEVREGDPLVLALGRADESQYRKQINEFRRGRMDKYKDKASTWDKGSVGVVTDVVRRGDSVMVVVKTKEPAQVGDKLVGRHGNKGVITRIVPDAEMPYRVAKDGEKSHMDILLNPLGVPGRINLGQVLETVAGKVAEKTGKPFEVKNFEPNQNYLESIKKDLAKHGLSDKEVLIDPSTGKPFEQSVLVGNQYILKLRHQAEKGISARSGTGGMGSHYDINHAPAGGAPHGGQSMGELGLYSLLGHNARNNIYEMYSYKTNHNQDFWDAIRDGAPIPPPKVPFAYDKFLKYLNGMRLDVRKEGNHLQLMPFTEEQVLKLSSGALKEPGLVVRAKDLLPMKDGLFDPRITGGHTGTKWSHFKLAEPIPNPLFESAIKKLTGLTDRKFNSVIRGDVEIDGKTGGSAIEAMLAKIDVKTRRKEVESQLKTAKGAGRDKLHAELRILKALDEGNLKPTVYMMRNVPVIPPVFRPVVPREDGSLSNSDINGLYKDIGAVNETLAANVKLGIPDSHLRQQREQLYDGVKALYGLGGSLTRDYQGILDILSGKVRKKEGRTVGTSKGGFFQKQLIKRRQDFSARAIITPEPRLGLDEVGLPEDIAWKLYEPFIQRQLGLQGLNPLEAQDAIKARTAAAEAAMNRVVQERPVLIKRDPALHKFNVMAFKPKLVKGKALEIHPMVTSGFNADFDGDKMSVYLPITTPAVAEAQKMFPSNNLFSSTTGAVMYTPGHEALLGSYLLTVPGKKTSQKFKSFAEAHAAVRSGKIKETDIIRVGGHETTFGRLLVEQKLPTWARETGKRKVSEMKPLDKKTLKKLLTDVAKKNPEMYGEVSNHIKDLGNTYSTQIGFSIGLEDFDVVGKKSRDTILANAEKEAAKIRRSSLRPAAKEEQIIKVYQKADKALGTTTERELQKNPTNIFRMVSSGSRGTPEQLRQIVSTPALVKDSKDRIVPYLIPRSYSEGMDMASYWTTMHGARKGTIQKTQGVRDPGYLTKQIVNSSMNQLITMEDCGVTDGVKLDTDNLDIADRYLAKTVRIGSKRYRAGTLITPDVLAAAAAKKVKNLVVRSPMRCKAPEGVCRKCMGLTEAGRSYDIGTNVGVLASQSIGEPSTQLSLSSFHTGGVAASKGSQAAGTFQRLDELLKMPRNLSNEAPLALRSGKVQKIEQAPQGGFYVTIDKMKHYAPITQELKVKPHQKVSVGQPLTDGAVDPKKLLHLRGVRDVQDYLSDNIFDVLKTVAPIRRRNIEVVVRAMTNITKIDDPGDHPEWVTGDTVPTSQVQDWNMKHRSQKPVRHVPVIHGVNVLPTEIQEDWVARFNFQNLSRTLAQAAREGWRSNIHGFHPIPAVAAATEFGKADRKLKPGEYRGQY